MRERYKKFCFVVCMKELVFLKKQEQIVNVMKRERERDVVETKVNLRERLRE